MKRIWNGEETIIDEIKRLVELREVLPCSIIKFYTHFSIGKEAFYFVTDPYESSNIEKLVMKLNRKGRAISPSKIIDFAMQILDALAFIHSRKIIHRDIKPKLARKYIIPYLNRILEFLQLFLGIYSSMNLVT